jgi:uncharacterized phosphosugar-binding protein
VVQSPEIGRRQVLEAATAAIARLADEQGERITAAGRLIADAVERGGVVHAFGTGHSQAVAMEIAGRAGGLVPTNRLSLDDGIWFGGDPLSTRDRLRERDPALGRRVYELAGTRPGDALVVASNSGINGAVVELAKSASDDGVPLIAFTSMAHTSSVGSRHPSGRKLHEFADVVIDNGAPVGDAVLPLPDGGRVCAVSSVTSALAVQMMVAEAVASLLERGVVPPVYASTNVPGADRGNSAVEARYEGRLRRYGG